VNEPVPFKPEEEEQVFKKEIEAEKDMLSVIKKKYQASDIFLFMCSKCKNHTMLLHMNACVSCGHRNFYFDTELKVDPEAAKSAIAEVMAL
jgi:hypothetical protein